MFFSSLFSKDSKSEPKEDKFEIPEYPCYAAVYKPTLKINIPEYFSGSRDDRLSSVQIFATAKEAIAYLFSKGSTTGSYILCMDQDLASVSKLKEEGKGFGAHIAKAILFSDYVMTTWEEDPMPAADVTIISNPYHEANKKESSVTQTKHPSIDV